MRRVRVLLVLPILVAGCGKKSPSPEARGETPEYLAWKGAQGIRQMATQGPSEPVPGSVRVHFPHSRSTNPDDFIELAFNGTLVRRARRGNGDPRQAVLIEAPLTLRPGVDWLDLWDSTTNRNYRFQVDPRQGRDFLFTPSTEGYDLTWTKPE